MSTTSLNPSHPILIVDDEPRSLKSFELTLRSKGFNNTLCCQDSRQVISLLESQEIEAMLLDLTMPHLSGLDILKLASEDFPEIPILIVTGNNEVNTAVDCMRHGAFDYVVKPVSPDHLLPSLKRALTFRQLRRENSLLSTCFLEDKLHQPEAFAKIITQNNKMRAVCQYCEAIAPGQQPVLITGETGTGKDLIANALHKLSGRKGQFVAVNVAGLDDTVFSDTLFGHAKGAYTGADRIRAGLVDKAAGGTLFLDEIGDLSPNSQVKFLRFLEERQYFPLGSDHPKFTDARVLAATQADLDSLLAKGLFRRDLFYRLKTHKILIPPLRERKEDIALLLNYFLQEAADEFGKPLPTYHPELLTLLEGYSFPGNIRELRAMVFDAVSGHKSKMLSSKAFKQTILSGNHQQQNPTAQSELALKKQDWVTNLDPLPSLKEASNIIVEEAMRRAKGNQRVAALMLGVTPQALSQRLKKLSL